MDCDSLNDLYKSGGLNYLTNSLGEEADDVEIPEDPYEWYSNLGVDSCSLLYLVKLDTAYGILAINEFDETTAKDLYGGNYEAMRAVIRQNAARINENGLFKECVVFVGLETGFNECDEIAVFLPYKMAAEKAAELLKTIDQMVYSNPSDSHSAANTGNPSTGGEGKK